MIKKHIPVPIKRNFNKCNMSFKTKKIQLQNLYSNLSHLQNASLSFVLIPLVKTYQSLFNREVKSYALLGT